MAKTFTTYQDKRDNLPNDQNQDSQSKQSKDNTQYNRDLVKRLRTSYSAKTHSSMHTNTQNEDLRLTQNNVGHNLLLYMQHNAEMFC